MTDSPDSHLCDAAMQLLRGGTLTDAGRALLEALVADPARYVEAPSPAPEPAGSSQQLDTRCLVQLIQALPGGLTRGCYRPDGQGTVDWFSPTLVDTFGVGTTGAGDLRALLGMLGIARADALFDELAQAARDGREFKAEIELPDRDGRPHWVRAVTVFDLPTEAGVGFTTLVLDITDIRQANDALVRADAAFRAMLRGTRSSFALIDRGGALLWFNDIALTYAGNMGWGTPEVGGQAARLFDDRFLVEYRHGCAEALAGRVFERRQQFTTARGRPVILDVSFRPVQRPDGEIFAIGFIASDVTRQVRTEQAVLESDRILGRLPLGVATVNPAGVIQRWRAAAPALFGLTPEAAEGSSLADLLVLEHERRVWPVLLEALRTGRELRVEVDARRSDGTQIPIELTLSPTPDADGHAVVLMEDVTVRRALTQQVVEAQKLEAVGIFAAGLAHDFNNLLAAIVGHTSMIELDMPADDPLRAELTGIEATAQRAATLVRSMLGLARERSGSARTIDLVQLVQGATPLLERVAGARCPVTVDVRSGSMPTRVDPVQIEQVLVNLVINARDASPHGGEIRVQLRDVVLTAQRAREMSMMPGRALCIDVEDRGEGISPVVIERVFDPFFTTKSEDHGTGLGLSICRQILRACGGEIQMESAVGQGTRVRLWLPCSPDEPISEAVDPGPSELGWGDERILLVEDVTELREVWTRLLTRLGYRVTSAADGVIALEFVEAGHMFDLLVSDVVMPRIGGLAVARRFREAYPSAPILMVSAYPGDSFDTGSLLPLDAQMMRKPVTGPDLVRRIRSLLPSA